ncbi:MAG: histidine phosphatase family protein [Planctomycetales bacterium]|nr:histidine phosphatase family protein [Planctomycetales bacterium]
MFIYVARHAWAYQYGDERWPDDSQRPLEEAGRERYALVVGKLAEIGFAPDLIATSPYARCVQTAEVIAAETPRNPQIVTLDELAPGSDFEALIAWTRSVEADAVCWVGHAPDVSFLCGELIGCRAANIRFAKGAVAAVRAFEEPGGGCGELYWLATAKSLGI